MNIAFKPDYNFYQLMPGIFLLEVDGNCDLAMSFLRTQEFYESVNDEFRGQPFTLDSYKEWYKTQSKTGEFSYGEDWLGFNIPSHVIEKCYAVNNEILPTDSFFLEINAMCKKLTVEAGLDSYYLLGVRKDDTDTLDHEIAHGLFTTNPQYKSAMLRELSTIEPSLKAQLFQCLFDIGYAADVHEDEAQAFLSTGVSKKMAMNMLWSSLHCKSKKLKKRNICSMFIMLSCL
jgi:hypothetical protein